MTSRSTGTGLGDRLAPLSDAVVAIALTLLAVELPVPSGHTRREVVDALTEAGPDYAAFLGSFAVIAALWTFHHRLLRYVERFTPRLIAVNLLWLLGIVLVPFATEVLAEAGEFWVGAAIYPAVVGFSGLMLIALTILCQVDGLLAEDIGDGLLRRSQAALSVPTAAFLTAVPLAFLSPTAATALWVAAVGITLLATVWSLRSHRG